MASAAFVTDLTEILTQATEAAAGIAGIVNGFKILDLAKDYYRLYNDQRQFYYDTFYSGVEAPLANEVYAESRPELDYAGRLGFMYNPVTGPLGGQATDAMGWYARHSAAYGALPHDDLVQEFEADKARIESDWSNYMFRFEETYRDLRDDIRWRKRLALHNIGIKTGTSVSSALAGALGAYQGHIQDFSNQLATYGNGVARYVGYKKGLADTADDFGREEYTPPTFSYENAYQAPRNMA